MNPSRILVVALRRLGDVLLTTPLIRSLKRAWPDAVIDVLVFEGTQGILVGNPDIATVLTIPERASPGVTLGMLRQVWRRYDVSFSTQSGDRPTLFAWTAGRSSVGFVETHGLLTRAKRFALSHAVEVVPNTHRVHEVLRLAQAVGVAPVAEVVPPQAASSSAAAPSRPYAVVHPVPKFRYKRWTDDGWRGLAAALAARGLSVVSTGGPDERGQLDELWNGMPDVRRLDGALAWPEIADLIRGAALYVGPDTSVTHLAAATSTPTIALFGPTDPRLWGPWPVGGLDPVWSAAGTIQVRRNVWLVQNPLTCLPCQQEGCMRHISSHSQCLDELTLIQVLQAVDAALGVPAGRRSA
jgi:heptosyltransferase-3